MSDPAAMPPPAGPPPITAIRRGFLRGLARGARIIWPALSALLLLIAGLGALVGLLEGWGVGPGLYFAAVTALTIGYGDLTPTGLVTKLLAVAIGVLGLLGTALTAGVAVAAFQEAVRPRREPGARTGPDRP